MFMQKDLFDGDGDRAPLARPGTSPGLVRPGTAGSLAGGAEESEDIATPGSVTNMRAKMMQQRERLLAKQKSAGLGAGSMVVANQGVPADQPSTPNGTRRPPTASGPIVGGMSPGSTMIMSNTMSHMSSMSAAGMSPTIAPGPSMHSLSTDVSLALDEELREKEGRGAVLPAPPQATKEEEEARRKVLAQELSERGICPEYDPAGAGDQKCNFDIGSVHPSDMRAFLHNPAPRSAGTLQCRIVRDRSGISTKLHPKYTLESDSGVFLMTAQKQVKNKTSNYSISMSKRTSTKDDEAFLGKLRSDFLGIEWVAYGPGVNPTKCDPKNPAGQNMQTVREELVAVQYTASKWGATAKGPRKMGVVIPHVQLTGERIVCRTLTPATEGLLALQKSGIAAQMIDTYNNKPPKWNDTIGAYVLNFNKRVTEPSVKNFQLISSTDPETVFLQFGRVGKEVFNLDFRYPLSPFQAFAMCLSSFDYKLGCE